MLAPSGIWNKQTMGNRLLLLSPCFLFGLHAGQGPTSPVAPTGFRLRTTVPPASPTSTAAALTPEPGFGAHPIAEPKQLARPSRAVSGGSGGSSSQWLELSLPTQDPSTTAAIQELLPQDNASSYSTPNG